MFVSVTTAHKIGTTIFSMQHDLSIVEKRLCSLKLDFSHLVYALLIPSDDAFVPSHTLISILTQN